ncbi:DUF1080 domain-containing protein [Parabacteroides acidifaciens]|uniref:DUF1080 domain-containing protein n=2 Tax=Parabacteroides acidifaciens TaxID=2290935 RepID=A0A3D8HFX4_9BACT|nr:DUF1080 domain-containing protein [Parabacteroides acidifaciens]RDU49879.1 DUF1080 domain-containing protein [Parabacteroides acidifaciens]
MFLFLWTGNIYSQNNQLTAKEKKEGWVLLFNGKNLDGWTSVGKDTPPAFGWVVEDGILNVRKQGDKRGGDIITRDQYSDFDLKVDFRITKGANSGIKYFFTKYEKGGWLGLEYQILDDENHPDAKLGRDGNRLEGGLYDMLPTSPKQVNPIGEWNQARIVAKGTKVTHYLNGKKILSFDRSSEQYKKAWQLSKYKNSKPMFGDVKEGHILLQDHGDEVSFRNVKIKVFK